METRPVEAAALSARGAEGVASANRLTENMIIEIFGAINHAEEVLVRGRGNALDLSPPIDRIDNGGPTYAPEAVSDAARSKFADQNREPSLVEKLQMIRDRIDDLRGAASYNADVTRAAVERLNGAV